MNWETSTLGLLGDFTNGVNFKSEQMGRGLRIINVKDIFNSGIFIDFESLELVDLENSSRISNYFVKQGDIFFVRSSVKREGIGLVTMARRSDERTVYCGFVIRFRPKSNNLDSLFLTYLLRAPEYRKKLMNLSGGAAITNISQTNLKGLEVPLPPLPTQKRIADILSKYDDFIDNNNRRIALLEESVHLLYREWFVSLRFPGHESVRVVDGVPEGWEQTTIGNAFSIMGGGTPSKKVSEYWRDGTINWYSPTDLTKTGTMFMERSSIQINETGLAKSSACLLPPFSVMMTSRATIGVIAINTTKCCTNQGFINCIPNHRISLYFLYCYLHANVEKTLSVATGGATFKEISKKVFNKFSILIPELQMKKKFEEKASILGNQILNLQCQNQKLKEARDSLLPRLMNGSLEV